MGHQAVLIHEKKKKYSRFNKSRRLGVTGLSGGSSGKIYRPDRIDDDNESNIKDRNMYDIIASKIINIEQYLGTYDKVVDKKDNNNLSIIGRVILDEIKRTVEDEGIEKGTKWSVPINTGFNYEFLTNNIRRVIDFWRRGKDELGSVTDLEITSENADNGRELRNDVINDKKEACKPLLEWEYNNFKQVISEQGMNCLNKERYKILEEYKKSKPYFDDGFETDTKDNFELIYNSVNSKTYTPTLKTILGNYKQPEQGVDGTDKGVDDTDKGVGTSATPDSSTEPSIQITEEDRGNTGVTILKFTYNKDVDSGIAVKGDTGTTPKIYMRELIEKLNVGDGGPVGIKNTTVTTAAPGLVKKAVTAKAENAENAVKEKAADAVTAEAEKQLESDNSELGRTVAKDAENAVEEKAADAVTAEAEKQLESDNSESERTVAEDAENAVEDKEKEQKQREWQRQRHAEEVKKLKQGHAEEVKKLKQGHKWDRLGDFAFERLLSGGGIGKLREKAAAGIYRDGCSKKRKYSFKKLPKRKRRNNKSNNAQAKKRGKRLNRSKKMSR